MNSSIETLILTRDLLHVLLKSHKQTVSHPSIIQALEDWICQIVGSIWSYNLSSLILICYLFAISFGSNGCWSILCLKSAWSVALIHHCWHFLVDVISCSCSFCSNSSSMLLLKVAFWFYHVLLMLQTTILSGVTTNLLLLLWIYRLYSTMRYQICVGPESVTSSCIANPSTISPSCATLIRIVIFSLL